jgi:hypothetical protein
MLCIVTSYGCGLSTACTVSASEASDTDTPSRTSAAACRRFSGVIRFNAPISSAAPQRPQFESSVFQRSYCSAVTLCESLPCPCNAVLVTQIANNSPAHTCPFIRALPFL